jgi:hypothetical protein
VRSAPLLFLTATLAAPQQTPPQPVFQAGTRLVEVEVEVVVRDQPGPPTLHQRVEKLSQRGERLVSVGAEPSISPR